MACCDTGLHLGLVLSVWSCSLNTPWRLSHISRDGACSLFSNSHVAFPHVDATDFITTVSTVSISNSCVVNRLHHFTVMRKYHVAFQVLVRSGSASAREPLQASQDNPDPSRPPHPSSVYFLSEVFCRPCGRMEVGGPASQLGPLCSGGRAMPPNSPASLQLSTHPSPHTLTHPAQE